MKQTLTLEERTIGDLFCRIVDPSDASGDLNKVVILCHGYGAGGDDLVPCARELLAAANLGRVRFVFPAAPIKLEEFYGDSRAWWPIDMVALQSAMETGNIRDLRNDQPGLLSKQRKSIMELIDQLKIECGLENSAFVLGGFSQGAMLATDVALHLADPPAGLVIWSGTLLNESNWKTLSQDRSPDRKFPIFQSHGRIDPIIPFVSAEWLQEMFETAGFEVDFLSFVGGHTISPEGIQAAARLIKGVSDGLEKDP